MDRIIARIFYTTVVVCILSFIYGYWNRFDEKYILYKLQYTPVIENEVKRYYVSKEAIKQYPEFTGILFEEKIIEGNSYINANNIRKALNISKNISTEIGTESSDNLVVIAETNIFIKISIVLLVVILVVIFIMLILAIGTI